MEKFPPHRRDWGCGGTGVTSMPNNYYSDNAVYNCVYMFDFRVVLKFIVSESFK